MLDGELACARVALELFVRAVELLVPALGLLVRALELLALAAELLVRVLVVPAGGIVSFWPW